MHLDVCRHFFSIDFVKRYLDLLAMHRMNMFHWHLTEDQGWRIEIKAFPKLTEIGAWRTEKDGSRYGGFYTRDAVREVVEYAASLGITVVPEIELPGHALAALSAYPEYSCTGGPFQVANSWGVFDDVYCAGKDATFDFLFKIFDEIIELFPGEFIHIGGDECPKTRWKGCPDCQARIKAEGLADEHELQSWFISKVGRYLESKGKRIIGWDEILEGGIPKGAAVMSWRGTEGGIKAALAGHDVVMSPGSHCYFDHAQAESGEPQSFEAVLTLERVYQFDPVPEDLPEDKRHHILGGQGNLWSEYIPTDEHAEYMLLPRLCALSETLWASPEERDFDDFLNRLKGHLGELQKMGISFRKPE